MSFSVSTRTVRNVVIVDLSGRVTVGESVRLLRETIDCFADQGITGFILNLEDADYIDSCGLGEIVATYISVCKRGGRIRLLKPSDRATRLLNTTRLSTVFSIFNDEETAIRSLTTKVASQ